MAHPTGTPSANPFDHAFEMLGQMPSVTTENVNAEALELLTQALTSRARERGRMILLRSPRAGFGKTHLLMRLHQRVAHTHEFIPLEPSKGRYLDAQSVLDAVLRRFSRVLPAGGGLTVLDLLARRILATALEPLVRSGEVPSQDRDSALQALQMRPVETFDFHNEEAVTARWAMANFSLLGPRLTAELAERTHAGYRPVAWWVELLFRYSSASIDQSTRNSSLFETVFGGEIVETDMHEKLVALLNLTGLVTSPVLILDEVEGFSSNPEAALQVTTFLNALHQSCDKLALIISVNGDVWETAFLPRIPCGLKDRLSDIVVDLKPMDKGTAVSMLRDRAGSMAGPILDDMDFETGVVYARGLIREASDAWESAPLAQSEDDERDGLQDPISLIIPPDAVPPDAISDVSPEPAQPDSDELESDEPPFEGLEESVPELHVPAAVVVPGTSSQSFAELEPSSAELADLSDLDDLLNPETPEPAGSVFSIYSDQDVVAPQPVAEPSSEPTEQVEQPAQAFEPVQPVQEPAPSFMDPRLPDDLPQPFAHQNQQAEAPSFGPPSEQMVQADPPTQAAIQENINPSPFTIAEGNPPSKALQQVDEQPQNVVNSPFSIDTAAVSPSPFQPLEPTQPIQAQAPQEPQPPQPTMPPEDSPFSVDNGKASPHAVTDTDHERVEDLLKQFRDRYGRD